MIYPYNYDLEILFQTAELLIARARDEQFDEAINWGDLHCADAEQYVTYEGVTGYRVYIEEASPDCPKFCQYIVERLAQAGYPDVEVKTEW